MVYTVKIQQLEKLAYLAAYADSTFAKWIFFYF